MRDDSGAPSAASRFFQSLPSRVLASIGIPVARRQIRHIGLVLSGVLCEALDMRMRPKKEKFLAETNPYLRDTDKRAEILLRQTIDSCAYEGIRGLGQRDSPSRSALATIKASAKKSDKAA